jgi:preprotein translocase subunit YajC
MTELAAQLLIFAADAPQAPAGKDGGGSIIAMMGPLVLIIVFFYFLLFLPQKRERKKQDAILKALKKNDRVVTIGGVVGTIVNIEPDSPLVTLRVDDNTRMVFLRSAIQRPYSDGKEEPSLKETTS